MTTTTTALGFTRTSVGKKVLMATTGVILFGFVSIHLLGNLQVYAGAATLDAYARTLRKVPLLLWAVRLALLAAALVHITTAALLIAQNLRSRGRRYARKRSQAATLASRTMLFTGPLLAIYVVYHLLHLTWGTAHPHFVELAPYGNITRGFSRPAAAAAYIAAMVVLGLHLLHGLWSIFQTFGLNNNRWSRRLRAAALVVAGLIMLGNISIPLAVLAGWVA